MKTFRKDLLTVRIFDSRAQMGAAAAEACAAEIRRQLAEKEEINMIFAAAPSQNEFLAALVALVDALPVFGTGTVLLPWALFSLLSGDWKLAIGLAVLYGLVSAVRSLLEPRLVGQKAGLPPLAALFAMYVGFRALGLWGMILSPLAAIFLKQLHDSGVFRLWRDSP